MKAIVVIGAGRIGSAVAAMLAATSDYRVILADRDQGRAPFSIFWPPDRCPTAATFASRMYRSTRSSPTGSAGPS